MAEEAEIYKITSINADGTAVVVYSTPDMRRLTSKMMMEEYGNVEEEGMAKSDLPPGILPEEDQN